nr:hypothetical protein [Edwardsiella ictaluri]
MVLQQHLPARQPFAPLGVLPVGVQLPLQRGLLLSLGRLLSAELL